MAAFGMSYLAAPDPALFDPRRLEGEIRRGAPLVAAYREALALGREHLKQGFDMGAGIDGLCAQRAWLIFRDAHCTVEGYEARGGSMEPMVYNGCRARITRERTAQLRPSPEN